MYSRIVLRKGREKMWEVEVEEVATWGFLVISIIANVFVSTYIRNKQWLSAAVAAWVAWKTFEIAKWWAARRKKKRIKERNAEGPKTHPL
jgi:hypothetical protein